MVTAVERTIEGYEGFTARLAISLASALGYLNARTRHRYTGVYRFDDPMLRCVALFDRENPTLQTGRDVPMVETYCSLVGARIAPFATSDAACDDELVTHPARMSVLAYCGVPLIGGSGDCIGTLCHFDDRPRLVPHGEIPLLNAAAHTMAGLDALRGPAA